MFIVINCDCLILPTLLLLIRWSKVRNGVARCLGTVCQYVREYTELVCSETKRWMTPAASPNLPSSKEIASQYRDLNPNLRVDEQSVWAATFSLSLHTTNGEPLVK